MAVLVISFILLSLFQSSLSIPVSPTKRALCPKFELPAECPSEIDHICLHDNQCSKGLICCNTGCQQNCVMPLYPTPSKTIPGSAVCPTFEPPAECPVEETNYCLDDSDCPIGLKCCNTGCELDCVVPDYSKTSKTPSTSSESLNFTSSKTPLTTPGSAVCPTVEPPAECPVEEVNYCLDDSECPNGLKCCNTGCELDCVVPDYSKTSKTPSTSSDACRSYKVLNTADRAQGKKDQTNVKCDQHLARGWYRFEGDAGDRMPDKCVPMRHCGTHAPGWIDGNHPTVAEDVVIRKVCYHWYHCCTWHNYIKVKNCGAYFVYGLQKTPACSRYCGDAGAVAAAVQGRRGQ